MIRLLRIQAPGIPLERMPDLLNDFGGDAGELLDELDAELAAQVGRLAGQRESIARLRAAGAAPGLPPELASFLALFAASPSSGLAKFDSEQSVLLAHFAGEDGMSHVARFYEQLGGPDLILAVADISERFSRLGPDSTAQDITELIESFMTTFAPVVA
ncbi:hypothetical protein AB0392_24700 [Nonomuraea angiospora]|uniref:hypothetical protein n=1 Tax=Nonomuraea angiospora TaxID=46172 RepID=UPI00344DF91B